MYFPLSLHMFEKSTLLLARESLATSLPRALAFSRAMSRTRCTYLSEVVVAINTYVARLVANASRAQWPSSSSITSTLTPALRAAARGRCNYCSCGRSVAAIPASACAVARVLYYYCYSIVIVRARLPCAHCVCCYIRGPVVRCLSTRPLDFALPLLALMRLPTHTRPSFTCSGAALCNTARHSLRPPSSAPPLSSLLRRKAIAGQSRVLLTAAATPRLHQQQQSQAATPSRSPLQWSGIAHRARNPQHSPPTAKMAGAQQQVRAHSHGHGGHHHHHDTTFLTSANRSDPGVKITRVGLYVNLGMAVAKGAGGYIFNSQA